MAPDIFWLISLAVSSRTNNADEMAMKNRIEQRELNATEPRIGIIDNSTSKRRAREDS